MSSIRILGTIALMLAAFGCVGQRGLGSIGPVIEKQLSESIVVVNRFWSAAAAQDLTAMQRESTGAKAAEWASRWRQAYPTFFSKTANSLEPIAAYTPQDQPEAIEILIEVPWVSCPPPAHEGNNDRYHVRLVPSSSGWLIADVWKDIC